MRTFLVEIEAAFVLVRSDSPENAQAIAAERIQRHADCEIEIMSVMEVQDNETILIDMNNWDATRILEP